MEEHIDRIKGDLATVEDVFAPLENMHTKNKFKIISSLFCDGLGITDIVFATFTEFESFFAERGIHIHVSMRSWTTKNELLE
jgi:hypothetical protein